MCGSVLPARSAAPPTRNLQRDPELVTATGHPRALTATIADSTVSMREVLERSRETSLPALLGRVAGVRPARSGEPGRSPPRFVRSAPSSRLLPIDGAAQTRDDASGATGIEHVARDEIERVGVRWADAGSRDETGGVKRVRRPVLGLLEEWNVEPAVRHSGRIEHLTGEDRQTVYGHSQPRHGAFSGVRCKAWSAWD